MVISVTLFLSSLTLLLAVANALLVSSSRSSATSINKGIHYQLGSRIRIRIRGGDNNNVVRNINNNNNQSSLLSQQQQQQHQHGMITDSTAAATATNADSDSDSDSSQPHILNVFPKEEEELLFINEVLRANFLFQDFSSIHEDKKGIVVENPSLSTVVESFEKLTYERGTVLCTQGDSADTDYLYLIASGSCSVFIDGKKLPDPYGTMGEGSLIGDLAMLYGTARAATVRCQTDVTVYRLHRTDFYHFLDQSSTSSNSDVNVDNNNNNNDHDTVSARQKEIQQQVKEIDEVIDQISGVKSKYDGSIIRQFQPDRYWLWSRWRGTILQHAWKTAAMNMLVSLFFLAGLRLANNHIFNNPMTWPIGEYRYRILYNGSSSCSTSRW
jgi:CRP-like cAMP-binding protein